MGRARHRPVEVAVDCVQLVVFDVGNVLIRICKGWTDACHASGVHLPACFSDRQTMRWVCELAEQHERGLFNSETFDSLTATLTGLTVEQVASVATAWLRKPFAGIEALIDRVDASGVKTACLSNTNDRHWLMMTGTGSAGLPLDRLHYRFVSHEIGYTKPHPAIYLHVETMTGVDPAAIVFFDDHGPNIQAAADRGWRVMQVTSDANPVAQMTQHLLQLGVL